MDYDLTRYNYERWKNAEHSIHQNRKIVLKKGKKNFVKKLYREIMQKDLNINNPVSFTEKINVNKINFMKNHTYNKYADKVKVRDYVKNKIGEEYLIPIYFSKKKITVEDLEKLPTSFVLKTNNGSGSNYIVKDKSKENLIELCNYLNRLSRVKYGYIFGEFHYNYIKPMIMAEKLLIDKKCNIPDDLKCFCFIDNNGIKRKILYTERVIKGERYRIMFDENWKLMDIKSSFEKLNIKITKPKNYKKILYVINKLSEDFNFVRVDLYLLNNKIYFGELTFTPTAGYLKFNDTITDLTWGSYIGNNLK